VLTESQILRFSRHVLLREVGGAGQLAFLAAAVRIPALDEGGRATALWLARAGVGALVLPADSAPAPGLDASGLLLAEDAGRSLVEAVQDRLRRHSPALQWKAEATIEAPAAGDAVSGAMAALDVLRRLLAKGGVNA
jgi:adenylyltransferase/sulfurtransferase